jgi:hypothetical protein
VTQNSAARRSRSLPLVRFRASCRNCDDVRVLPEAVTLVVDAVTGATSYDFVCPNCKQPIRCPAPPASAELLAELGARVVLESVPRNGLAPRHLAERPDGPVRDESDLGDLSNPPASERRV